MLAWEPDLQVRERINCPCDETPDNIVLCPITFARKSLYSAETRYNNTDREALSILHGLDELHHYCFLHKVILITNDEPLVGIFKKGVAALLQ